MPCTPTIVVSAFFRGDREFLSRLSLSSSIGSGYIKNTLIFCRFPRVIGKYLICPDKQAIKS